jgi:hypothetical protein
MSVQTVTLVLGMRDYGRGWFSAYFAGLVVARLGLPFRRVRIYYSATLPAVSQTPRKPGFYCTKASRDRLRRPSATSSARCVDS